MPREAPQLDRIERWMQAIIMHPDGTEQGIRDLNIESGNTPLQLEEVILPSKQLSALERLSIYSNMYFMRLVEVLSKEYPTVLHLLGQELFNNVMIDYVTRHPSTYYNLNRLSNKFPQYLRDEAADIPHQEFASDVACVERAMEDVFDERYIKRIADDELLNIPTDKWAQVRLQLTPALRMLELKYPVNNYMTAVRKDRHMDIPAPEKSYVIVYRSNYRAWREDLDLPRFTLLSGLYNGDSLASALEACASLPDINIETLIADLGAWFKDWATVGLFCGIDGLEE